MHRLSFAALAIMLALVSPAGRADELAEANALLRSGQHQQAMERVNKLLAVKPADPQARFLKGLIYVEQGNSRAAIDIFRKLTEDYPELPEPYNNLAVVYASMGQYERARTSLEQSIRTHPSYATAYENLGDVYAKLASQAYDKALKLDSSNAGAQNKLALVRDLVGASPHAVATATVIAATQPEPAPPATPSADTSAPKAPAAQAEPLDTVRAWAQAWSRKDADAYLGYYDKAFQTPNGEPRREWEKQRRQRVLAPKTISVGIEAARVSREGETRASVTFRQDYRSDRISSRGTKTLLLGKSDDGHWRILQEKVSN